MAQATVSGIVVDVETNAPIVGATVAIQGANANAITDDKGKFTIKTTKAKQSLQFSCIGYERLVLPVSKTGEYDLGLVPLAASSVSLKDAVVTTRAIARKTPVSLTTLG